MRVYFEIGRVQYDLRPLPREEFLALYGTPEEPKPLIEGYPVVYTEGPPLEVWPQPQAGVDIWVTLDG